MDMLKHVKFWLILSHRIGRGECKHKTYFPPASLILAHTSAQRERCSHDFCYAKIMATSFSLSRGYTSTSAATRIVKTWLPRPLDFQDVHPARRHAH